MALDAWVVEHLDLVEQCLVELPPQGSRCSEVGRLWAVEKLQRLLQDGLEVGDFQPAAHQLQLEPFDLPSQLSLLFFQDVGRDGTGVVGIEQFLALCSFDLQLLGGALVRLGVLLFKLVEISFDELLQQHGVLRIEMDL